MPIPPSWVVNTIKFDCLRDLKSAAVAEWLRSNCSNTTTLLFLSRCSLFSELSAFYTSLRVSISLHRTIKLLNWLCRAFIREMTPGTSSDGVTF